MFIKTRLFCSVLVGLIACGRQDEAMSEVSATQEPMRAGYDFAAAVLKNAAGDKVGVVNFISSPKGDTLVIVSVSMGTLLNGMHGFHVHANDNADNGTGCVADPTQPESTFFVSADGHYNPSGATHGHHDGDMPALLINDAGTGYMTFTTDSFNASQLRGRAVIVHSGADNYGNVPVGAAPNQYQPNAPDATTLTQNTGNASARIACGVVN